MVMVAAAPFVWEIIYPMPYANLIHQYSEQNDLDPFLVAAVIRTESRFDSRATSRKDARGLMQILPSTGAWIAATIGLGGFTAEQLYDPEVSIMLGTWYMRDLLRQFGGSLPAALAAYNAGPTAVQGWLHEECWNGSADGVADVPYGETRDYITKVLSSYDVYSEVHGREATLATSVIRRAWARLSR
jgi:soluble lytic murein transglycosylase